MLEQVISDITTSLIAHKLKDKHFIFTLSSYWDAEEVEDVGFAIYNIKDRQWQQEFNPFGISGPGSCAFDHRGYNNAMDYCRKHNITELWTVAGTQSLFDRIHLPTPEYRHWQEPDIPDDEYDSELNGPDIHICDALWIGEFEASFLENYNIRLLSLYDQLNQE